ncbi:cell division protein FtsQ/DivIB [Alterisphingorhabdus coralli]|uniref:Cell division protein FtsQ n=1 Tax=Alterisphingorhabdus coralli TaxID=3071408 RepID=A0AA97F931_9SPHN|nr:cell division protein FtsQ/DivIB [Parasphingorhabdus sp. SCSIO 66989]WOE76156.1 FtsQ-type POTRA domain-containing protein [Parasphingorhabdus sp. SCSIO 66989]
MTAAKTKRGKPQKARKSPQRKRTVKRTSIMDRLLKVLPFTPEQVQRAMTFAIVAGVVLGVLAVAKIAGVTDRAGTQLAEIAGDAGFEVKHVEVRGLENVNELKVYEIVLAEKDRAMPLVDLDRLRNELMQFGWIGDARVSRQLPDTLIVDIVEREPHAVWNDGKQLAIIDDEGRLLEVIKDAREVDLPLISGKNANTKAAALDALMDQAPALEPMVTEAKWVGNRRWDLVFQSGETLALPEGEEASKAAFVTFARMEGVNRLLGTGVTHFDLRDPDRAYFRLPQEGSSAGGEAQP